MTKEQVSPILFTLICFFYSWNTTSGCGDPSISCFGIKTGTGEYFDSTAYIPKIRFLKKTNDNNYYSWTSYQLLDINGCLDRQNGSIDWYPFINCTTNTVAIGINNYQDTTSPDGWGIEEIYWDNITIKEWHIPAANLIYPFMWLKNNIDPEDHWYYAFDIQSKSNILAIDDELFILTFNPTQYPSVYPSNIPSIYPSNKPSIYPSHIPSLYPSDIPTIYPSNKPTITTIHPITIPTTNPVNTPTIYPSKTPTIYPTNIPTLFSMYPTLIPSYNPTIFPTKHRSNIQNKNNQEITIIIIIMVIFGGVILTLVFTISILWIKKKRRHRFVANNIFDKNLPSKFETIDKKTYVLNQLAKGTPGAGNTINPDLEMIGTSTTK